MVIKKQRVFLTAIVVSTLGASSLFAQAAPVAQAPDTPITRYTFRNVAKTAAPAVVNIRIKSNITLGRDLSLPPGQSMDDELRDRLERFFDKEGWNLRQGFGEDYKYARSGSGVIIRQDGYVTTSEHVIKDVAEDDIEVSLPDGRTFSKIEIVGTDGLTDLAVLKINDEGTSNLPFLQWGDSDAMEVGDHVVAIGNPLDFTNSVSEGIISAKHRTINKVGIEDLLQTTAMINPGNSGGALVDLDGKLVGINMAIATSTGMWSGLGFAIPGKTVKTVTEQIITKGKALRGYLGIKMESLVVGAAKFLGYRQDYGILVEDVTAGSAAEKAGLLRYDIIAAVNGNKIRSMPDMHRNIGNLPVGEKVVLEVWRDSGDGKGMKQLEIPVVLGERPDDQTLSQSGPVPGSKAPELPGDKPDSGMLGLKLEPSDDGSGMMVKGTQPNSPAADVGLREGDTILQVNRKDVKSAEDFKEALKANNTGSHMFFIERDKATMMQMVPGN